MRLQQNNGSCLNFSQVYGNDSYTHIRLSRRMQSATAAEAHGVFYECEIQWSKHKWHHRNDSALSQCAMVRVCIEELGPICIAFQIKTSCTTNTPLLILGIHLQWYSHNGIPFQQWTSATSPCLVRHQQIYIINCMMICLVVFSCIEKRYENEETGGGKRKHSLFRFVCLCVCEQDIKI